MDVGRVGGWVGHFDGHAASTHPHTLPHTHHAPVILMVMPLSTPGGTSTLTVFVLRSYEEKPSRTQYANSTSRLQPWTASWKEILGEGEG